MARPHLLQQGSGGGGGGYYLINNARNTLVLKLFPIIPTSSSNKFNKADHPRRLSAKILMKKKKKVPSPTSTPTPVAGTSSNKFDSPSPAPDRRSPSKIRAPPPPQRRRQQRRRSLIKISPNGNYSIDDDDKWKCDYILSLKQLDLQDLAADPEQEEEVVDDDQGLQIRDTQVSISLSIQQHASFGLSVDGRIRTSFTRKCIICSSPYCSKLDTKFNIWVLPSRRQRRTTPMPEIGGDDPSVIYVKPGDEADLDSHIRDTIRLATSFQETCSKSCDQSEPIVHYVGEQKAPSIDSRWSKLLELKNSSYS